MSSRIAILAIAAALTACANPRNSAVFVTKTSIAIVDADSAPASISFAFDRVEGYIGPRFDDGSVMPVVGYLETDGAVMNRKVKQVYATGPAALIALNALNASAPQAPASASGDGSTPVMFFGTGTTIGLKLGFAEGTPVPNSFTLGYRRKELSIIPVEKGRFTSTLASLDNEVATSTTDTGSTTFGVRQYFATGGAAEQLAAQSFIHNAFLDHAEEAIPGLQKYRNEEANQGKIALDTVVCLQRLPDDRLGAAWTNAEESGVFVATGAVDRVRAASTAAAQRAAYMNEIRILNPDSAQHTKAMQEHRDAICKLSKS